jgi:hypothetical protein
MELYRTVGRNAFNDMIEYMEDEFGLEHDSLYLVQIQATPTRIYVPYVETWLDGTDDCSEPIDPRPGNLINSLFGITVTMHPSSNTVKLIQSEEA